MCHEYRHKLSPGAICLGVKISHHKVLSFILIWLKWFADCLQIQEPIGHSKRIVTTEQKKKLVAMCFAHMYQVNRIPFTHQNENINNQS